MYELLTEEYTSDKPKVSLDTKINTLFNNKILIPITDEFLRFHKDNERYDNIGQTVVDKKNKLAPKKDNTKIKYIVNKINKLVEYYFKEGNLVLYLSNDQRMIFKKAD